MARGRSRKARFPCGGCRKDCETDCLLCEKSESGKKGPTVEEIAKATADVPVSDPEPHPTTGSGSIAATDFQTELCRILISLIEVSQKLLCLNPEASKIFKQAEEILNEQSPSNRVDESDLKPLIDMGFKEGSARKALLLNKNCVEAAMDWLLMHGDDNDHDNDGTPTDTEDSPNKQQHGAEGGTQIADSPNEQTNKQTNHRVSNILHSLRAYRKREFRPNQKPIFSDTALLSKRDVKVQTRLRLQDAMVTSQKICIDCSLEDWMSEKEKGKLAMQIGRLYGANKKADCPAHIYLTGLDLEKSLYRECVKKNDGFQHYLMDVKPESHTELFPLEKIVYLSPDSDNLLTDIDPDKVYIIGGLVVESVTKNITETKAKEAGIRTARLPIHEYMDRLHQNTYSKVLALNQVFDIIVAYTSTHDWSQALAAGVPR